MVGRGYVQMQIVSSEGHDLFVSCFVPVGEQ